MRVKTLALPTTVAMLVLLLAGPVSSQALSMLDFKYQVGQSFHYHGDGIVSSPTGRRHSGEGDFLIKITSRSSTGWHATETITHPNAIGRQVNITIADDGTWTNDADGTVLANFVSFDPRTACRPPAPLRANSSWSCNVQGNHLRPGGAERIVVTALTRDSVTLDLTGTTPVTQQMQTDSASNTPVATQANMTWHDTITFKNGRKTRIVTTEVHRLRVSGISAPLETTMHSTTISQ